MAKIRGMSGRNGSLKNKSTVSKRVTLNDFVLLILIHKFLLSEFVLLILIHKQKKSMIYDTLALLILIHTYISHRVLFFYGVFREKKTEKMMKKLSLVEQAMALVGKMSDEELAEFKSRLNTHKNKLIL